MKSDLLDPYVSEYLKTIEEAQAAEDYSGYWAGAGCDDPPEANS